MRKVSDNDDGSLELLLDTICNTFGGVLFISMLVVMLLNMSSQQAAHEQTTTVSQAELAGLKSELTRSREELARWRKLIAEQEKAEQQIVEPELRELVEGWISHQGERARLSEDKSDSLETIATAQQEVNDIVNEVQDLMNQVQHARTALAAAEAELQREISRRSVSAELPRAQATAKLEVAFLVRDGRVWSVQKMLPDGTLVLNSVECDVADDRVLPRPGQGTALGTGPNAKASFKRILGGFRRDQHFLTIVFWPSAFETVIAMKEAAIEANFNYTLLPIPDGEHVMMGSSTQKKVQ